MDTREQVQDEVDEDDEASDDEGAAANPEGMDGERVFKSGFLIKKQERRKVGICGDCADFRFGRRSGLSCARQNWHITKTTGWEYIVAKLTAGILSLARNRFATSPLGGTSYVREAKASVRLCCRHL